jgi:hypothetical protein
MDVTRLEQRASLKRGGTPRDSSVRKNFVLHGFHKLTVAFSNTSPSHYAYFELLFSNTSAPIFLQSSNASNITPNQFIIREQFYTEDREGKKIEN